MVQYHAKGLRKPTTGMRRAAHKKKVYERGGTWVETKLGEQKQKIVRTKGGDTKVKLVAGQTINLVDPSTHKTQKTKVVEVLEHSDNPNYIRRMFLTKGCIVKTELGKARVTSRPGQHGILNGILVK